MFILKAEMHDKLHMHKAKPVINAHCLVSLYSVFSGFALLVTIRARLICHTRNRQSEQLRYSCL